MGNQVDVPVESPLRIKQCRFCGIDCALVCPNCLCVNYCSKHCMDADLHRHVVVCGDLEKKQNEQMYKRINFKRRYCLFQ